MSPKKGDIMLVKINYSQRNKKVEVQEDLCSLYISLSFGKVWLNNFTVKDYGLIKLTKLSTINRLKKYNYQ